MTIKFVQQFLKIACDFTDLGTLIRQHKSEIVQIFIAKDPYCHSHGYSLISEIRK